MSKSKIKLLAINETWPWFGNHTGYGKYLDFLDTDSISVQKIDLVKTGWHRNLLGKLYSRLQSQGTRNPYAAYLEHQLINQWHQILDQYDLIHFLYFDTHHYITQSPLIMDSSKKLIGTLHHPVPRPLEGNLKSALEKLSQIIYLAPAQRQFISPASTSHTSTILHGVDIDFFSPATRPEMPSLLLIGFNGRDVELNIKIISQLADQGIRFNVDLVGASLTDVRDIVPVWTQNGITVTLHKDLSDLQLLELYRRSRVQLLTLKETTANNALVESLSCGLPIVANDHPCLRNYGGGEIFPIFANNSIHDGCALIEKLFKDDDYWLKVSQKQRSYAENHLSWKIISEQHLLYFKSLV